MLIDLRHISPGQLPNPVFDEFIAGNNYSSEMVCALRDHLVNGMPVKDAIGKHGIYPNKFRMRLETMIEQIRRVGRINAHLCADLGRLNEVFTLADRLLTNVRELQVNATLHPAHISAERGRVI
jgi:hypothetical protein